MLIFQKPWAVYPPFVVNIFLRLAFGLVPRFENENEFRLDTNQRAYYPSFASNRWLAIRLEFVGSLIIFGSALFAVISLVVFGNVDGGLVGLSVAYALQVTQTLNWMVQVILMFRYKLF